MHFCVYSCKVELDEMRRGLLSLNFIGAMNGNPSLKALFKFNAEAQTLTAEEVEKLFVPLFSPQGSNKRSKEEQVMMHFLEFLQDLEGEYYSCKITCIQYYYHYRWEWKSNCGEQQ